MSNNFYITTPIYYVNDKPHIGHAYTTILADVLSRYQRSLGFDTFFLTGTDEHGQKVEKAANARNVAPIDHCNETVVRFQELWKRLGITNDFFIRTTYDFHKEVVRKILQDLYDRGEIYRAEYTGWYCVGCERFFTEKDLVEGKCPDCGREVSAIQESNYFFRMSKYRDWLVDYIKSHPDFILPSFRANETLGFLRQELGDLCISRPKSRLAWGIELPFDTDYVCYVWFDALINYISGVGYLQNDDEFARRWPASCHLIGKDILTTHSVYWPTMLKAIGLPMPKTIFAHGWWLTGNAKMSKSTGNVVDPMAMIDKAGVDAFRYFLLSEMSPGSDANFSEEAFISRYNSDLANDLGNLLSRVSKMVVRSGGVVQQPKDLNDIDKELLDTITSAVKAMSDSLAQYKPDQGIDAAMGIVRAGNRYLEQCAPWKLAKEGNTERLNDVLFCAAEALRVVAVLLEPVMPEKMAELAKVLGYEDGVICSISEVLNTANGIVGRKMSDTAALFPRILVEEEKAPEAKPAKKEKKAEKSEKKAEAAPETAELISIDDFFKTKLKTAKIVAAERVPDAKKLLKLQLEVGTETRQIVSGIAESYTPEELIGKTIVVVSNLQKAVIRGVESSGMLLAAGKGDKIRLVTLDGDVPSGIDVG